MSNDAPVRTNTEKTTETPDGVTRNVTEHTESVDGVTTHTVETVETGPEHITRTTEITTTTTNRDGSIDESFSTTTTTQYIGAPDPEAAAARVAAARKFRESNRWLGLVFPILQALVVGVSMIFLIAWAITGEDFLFNGSTGIFAVWLGIGVFWTVSAWFARMRRRRD